VWWSCQHHHLQGPFQAGRGHARPETHGWAWADRVLGGAHSWGALVWCRLPSSPRPPQATFYGQQQAQDSYADCSLSENYANVNHLPWTTGISTTLALNGVKFGDSAACGLCVMYRGTRARAAAPVPVPAQALCLWGRLTPRSL